MAEVLAFEAGGYRYIKAVFQYSGGVAAEPGYEIERARLVRRRSRLALRAPAGHRARIRDGRAGGCAGDRDLVLGGFCCIEPRPGAARAFLRICNVCSNAR